jgi:hypothetical protein
MKTGKADANTFAAQVSAGWWRDKIVNFFGKKSAFRAQLILRYADGTEKRIGTDTTWLSATTGPVIRAAIFDGEDYDARVKTCWMKGKPCDKFKASEINTEFKGEIFPMTGAPIRLREDIAIAPAEMYVWKGADGAKNPDAKPYVGTWYWRDQAAGTLHYKWNDKDMGNSYLTGEAQVVFKTVDNVPECWLNLDSEIESNNNKGKYLVKLKVGMHEFK